LHGCLRQFCEHIDKASRRFLWKGSSDKGIHLVGWDKVTRPRNEGGLGIRKAREANTSMLGKLVWDIHNNTDKLWVKLSKHKYVGDKPFMDMPNNQGSIVWNSVVKAKAVLRPGFDFRLGDGSSSFWYTPWTSFGKLSNQVLYVDIHDLQLSVSDMFQGGR